MAPQAAIPRTIKAPDVDSGSARGGKATMTQLGSLYRTSSNCGIGGRSATIHEPVTAQHEDRGKQQSEGSCSDLQRHYEEPHAASSMQTYTAVIPKPTILASLRPSIRSSTSAFPQRDTSKSVPRSRSGTSGNLVCCCASGRPLYLPSALALACPCACRRCRSS